MSNKNSFDYTKIETPYNSLLERSEGNLDSGSIEEMNEGQPESPNNFGGKILDGSSFNDLWIDSWIKSRSYKPKTHGFLIDGRLGYIECMKLHVGSGGIVGGSLNVPNETSSDSWHVDADGNMWSGCSVEDFALDNDNASAYTLNNGTSKFQSITVIGGVVDGTSTIGGRDASDLASAINSSANLITDIINSKLDTDSKRILSDFDFGTVNYAGAVKAGDITWNSSGIVTGGSGVAVYRKGIVGANDGDITFSIDATTGDASFSGDISASNVTGSTVTGGTIQTSVTGARTVITGNDINLYSLSSSDSFPFISFNQDGTNDKGWDIYFTAYGGGGYDAGELRIEPQTSNSYRKVRFGNVTDSTDIIVHGDISCDDITASTFNGSSLPTGTVTSVATSGAIVGGTITTSGTISHSTSAGYKHIPTGGGTQQYLKYSASGAASWQYLGATANAQTIVPTSGTANLGSSSYYWDIIYGGKLNLRPLTNNPSSAGDIVNYASGTVDQFRGRPGDGSWNGSFDMSAY